MVLDSGTRGTDENLEIAYEGLMLEVGFIGLDEHQAEAVLARPDRAGTLARTRILADPNGVLAALQQEVAGAYAERRWVAARCDVEKQTVAESLAALIDAPGPLPRLYGLVGAIFGLAGLLAVARLEVPTNRRAQVGLKQMLEAEGRAELHGEVLEVCGVAGLSRSQVEAHHRAMLRAFDLAVLAEAPAPLPRLYGLVGVMFGLAGLLAVARLEVPTNRRALVGLKQMLEAEGRAELHGEVLEVCGVAGLSRSQVEAHHRAMLRAFDLAVQVRRTFVPYSFKIEAHVRPYANEAIAELIEEGHHREVALYLALPFSTANAVVQNDAQETEKLATQAEFDRLLGGFDLLEPRDWAGRVERIRGLAAELERVADARVATRS
jgi:hypothetical protein